MKKRRNVLPPPGRNNPVTLNFRKRKSLYHPMKRGSTMIFIVELTIGHLEIHLRL